MLCSQCGAATTEGGRCGTCGAATPSTSLLTGVIPIDTTGLPPGATLGASTTAAHTAEASTAATTGAATGGAPAIAHSAPAKAGPLMVGQSFGPRYHIIKLLGIGGMGAVYQTWDAELSVAVALKVIRTDRRRASPEAEKRFKNELLLARQVTHKHVVRIHDLGEIDSIKYLTMPYVQGEDLASTLRRDGKLPVALALNIARQIAAGLEAAHDAGVVHRDLKPANVMISAAEDDVHALIMDFGISVSATDATAGGIVGTLEYMAPEQGTGGHVDARADIYALGLILYEMLTGPRPVAHSAQERIDAMRRRCQDGLPRLRAVAPDLPEPLEAFVTRCLEPDPAARFQTTSELCAALARLDARGELIPEVRRLTWRLVAGAAAVTLALLGVTYVFALRNAAPAAVPDPVSVVIADFENRTKDLAFDGTLEPMVDRALEGAGFVTAYDRSGVAAALAVQVPEVFDEGAALEVAVNQGLGVVLSGFIEPQGAGYRIGMKAVRPLTNELVTEAEATANSRDAVLEAATRAVTRVRTALGDEASESDQMFAMTSLTTTSLDVVRHYAAAQEASSNGDFDEARKHLLQAVAVDPAFGVGYQLLAVASRNMGNLQDATGYIDQALKYLPQMTDRERYSTRGFYNRLIGDYQQCASEYREMIARYAADVVGRNGLALCLSYLRDMPAAMEEMSKIIEILPKRTLFRNNRALYANYAGEFAVAEQEVQAIETPDAFSGLALAFSYLGRLRLADARAAYEKMSTMPGARGPSLRLSGLADLAAVEGRYDEAVRLLREGVKLDLSGKYRDRAATKLAAIGYVELQRRRPSAAVAAFDEALENSQAVKIRFLAGRAFIEAGEMARAQSIADTLAAQLEPEPEAYGRLLLGNISLAGGDSRRGIREITDANGTFDTWIGHYDLGRAYLAAKAPLQAAAEFERTLKRSGEALSLFLDEEPTFAYVPMAYYYQGLVREEQGDPAFADSYRTYLQLRGDSREDLRVADLRQRIKP